MVGLIIHLGPVLLILICQLFCGISYFKWLFYFLKGNCQCFDGNENNQEWRKGKGDTSFKKFIFVFLICDRNYFDVRVELEDEVLNKPNVVLFLQLSN